LQRDVRPHPLEPPDHLLVRGHDGVCLGLVAHPLPEERRIRVEAAVVEPAQYEEALVKRLPRHEPAGAEPHPVAAHEALDARAVGRGQDRPAEHVVESGTAAHCVASVKLQRETDAAYGDRLAGVRVEEKTSSAEVLSARERYVPRGIAASDLVVTRAWGARIWDAEGREYLDFAGGIACQN